MELTEFGLMDDEAPVAEDPRVRAAKLRMLQYLSQPALPFFPEDSAA